MSNLSSHISAARNILIRNQVEFCKIKSGSDSFFIS